MSQAPVDQNDPRSRHASQSYGVTYFGKSMETGPTGVNSRLSGTLQSNIKMTAPADVAGAQVMGDLTQGCFVVSVINHVALSALSTLELILPAYNGEAEMIITTQVIDLTAPGVIFTGINPLALAPLNMDRPMTATIAAGTGGEVAEFSLVVTPAESGWK